MVTSLIAIARWRYALFALWLAYTSARWVGYQGGDWHFFREGSDLIVGRHPTGTPGGGLHLWANYPDLQMGPLGFVLAWPFRLLSAGDGGALARVVMCALALPIIFLLERTALRVRGLDRMTSDPLLAVGSLVGGVVLISAWVDLAGTWAHFADVLVLCAAAVAVWAVAARRPWLLGLMVGAAITAKPWGVFLLSLAFALPWRAAVRSIATAAALAAAGWLPFVLGDPRTLHAIAQVAFPNDLESGLRALGVHSYLAPHWLRPVQLGLGVLLGLLAVGRKRWPAVLLVAVAARLALDPRVLSYYAAGLILAALIWDLCGSRLPLPLWTVVAYLGLHDVNGFVVSPHERGLVRLVLVSTLAMTALVLPRVCSSLMPATKPRLRPATSPAG